MNSIALYLADSSPAIHYAGIFLSERGLHISKDAAAVNYLLLPVPSFDAGGKPKWEADLPSFLAKLPENVTVIGGNLHHPLLEKYNKLDLMQDEEYLAQAYTRACRLACLR